MALPSLTLLGQSLLSGIFIGALYGLLGLGLSLSWGIMRQVDLAQHSPGKAQAEPEQPVQRPDENARKQRLAEKREARQGHALLRRYGVIRRVPDAANSFGQTTTHLPCWFCFTL